MGGEVSRALLGSRVEDDLGPIVRRDGKKWVGGEEAVRVSGQGKARAKQAKQEEET